MEGLELEYKPVIELKDKSFLVVMSRKACDRDVLVLPKNFVNEFDNAASRRIVLELPNGREIYLTFIKESNGLHPIREFFQEFMLTLGVQMLFIYKGDGRFLVLVFDEEASEITYEPLNNTPDNKLFLHDESNGIGWKFLSLITAKSIEHVVLELPKTFCDRFRNRIPAEVTVKVLNREVFVGTFCPEERQIKGMIELINSKAFEHRDAIMVTYYGLAKFDIFVFDRNGIGKAFSVNEASKDNEIPVEQQTELIEIEDSVELDINPGNEIEVEDILMQFSVVLKRSHINNTSHGLIIPSFINPPNDQWSTGDHVTVRTHRGSWTIGLVLSNGKARFSSGWNKFCRENKLYVDQRLTFNLVEEEDGIAFNME